MRIDELPHHSTLFYKLNFVSRRQFFHKHWNMERDFYLDVYTILYFIYTKHPSKMQKVPNDQLFYNKTFKRVALFPY